MSMEKESIKKSFGTVFPFIVVVAVIVIWFFFVDPFYLKDSFKTLSSERIEDLSKTIIQTGGILVGFIAVSGFFYLGKLGELLISICSMVSEQISGLETARVAAEDISNYMVVTEAQTRAYCAQCPKTAQCKERDEYLEMLAKNEKNASERKEKYAKQADETLALPQAINDQAKKMEQGIMVPLSIAMFFLFSTIVLASFAYVSRNPLFLVLCIDFIVSAIAFISLTWALSYQSINDLRRKNVLLLELKSSLNLISSSLNSMRKDMELANQMFEKMCASIRTKSNPQI
jgi:hypothetical protein